MFTLSNVHGLNCWILDIMQLEVRQKEISSRKAQEKKSTVPLESLQTPCQDRGHSCDAEGDDAERGRRRASNFKI